MFALCGSDNALLSLKKAGAVRERGGNLELWAADAALKDPLMQKILDTAQRAYLCCGISPCAQQVLWEERQRLCLI